MGEGTVTVPAAASLDLDAGDTRCASPPSPSVLSLATTPFKLRTVLSSSWAATWKRAELSVMELGDDHVVGVNPDPNSSRQRSQADDMMSGRVESTAVPREHSMFYSMPGMLQRNPA